MFPDYDQRWMLLLW